MLGADILMADDSDNTRAILSIKVGASDPWLEFSPRTERTVLRLGERRCSPHAAA